jgi:D-aminopeptidase
MRLSGIGPTCGRVGRVTVTDLAAVLADAHQNGADTIIAHDAHDIITLQNVSLSQLHDSHILLE